MAKRNVSDETEQQKVSDCRSHTPCPASETLLKGERDDEKEQKKQKPAEPESLDVGNVNKDNEEARAETKQEKEETIKNTEVTTSRSIALTESTSSKRKAEDREVAEESKISEVVKTPEVSSGSHVALVSQEKKRDKSSSTGEKGLLKTTTKLEKTGSTATLYTEDGRERTVDQFDWHEVIVKFRVDVPIEAAVETHETLKVMLAKITTFLRKLFSRCGIVEKIEVVGTMKEEIDSENGRVNTFESRVRMNRISEAARVTELWDNTDHNIFPSSTLHLDVFWGYPNKNALLSRKIVSVKLEPYSEIIEPSVVEEDMIFRFGSCGDIESIQVLDDPRGAFIRFESASSAARAVEDAADRGAMFASGATCISVDILHDEEKQERSEKEVSNMKSPSEETRPVGDSKDFADKLRKQLPEDPKLLKKPKEYPPTTGRTRRSSASSVYVENLNKNKRTRSVNSSQPGHVDPVDNEVKTSNATVATIKSVQVKKVDSSRNAVSEDIQENKHNSDHICDSVIKQNQKSTTETVEKPNEPSILGMVNKDKKPCDIEKSDDVSEKPRHANNNEKERGTNETLDKDIDTAVGDYESLIQRSNIRNGSGIFIVNSNHGNIQNVEQLISSLSGVSSYQVTCSRKDYQDRSCVFVTFENDTIAMEMKKRIDGLEFPKGSNNYLKAIYEESSNRKRRTEDDHSQDMRSNMIRARHEKEYVGESKNKPVKRSLPKKDDTVNHTGVEVPVQILKRTSDGRNMEDMDASDSPLLNMNNQMKSTPLHVKRIVDPQASYEETIKNLQVKQDNEVNPPRDSTIPRLSKSLDAASTTDTTAPDDGRSREWIEPADDLADNFRSAIDLGYAATKTERSFQQSVNHPMRQAPTMPMYTPSAMHPHPPPVHHPMVHQPHPQYHHPISSVYPPHGHGHSMGYGIPHQMPHWDSYGSYYHHPANPLPRQDPSAPSGYLNGQQLPHGIPPQAGQRYITPAQMHSRDSERLSSPRGDVPSSSSTRGGNVGVDKVKQEGSWLAADESTAPVNTSRLYVRFERPFKAKDEDAFQNIFDMAAPGLEYVSRHLGKSFAFVKYSSSESALQAKSRLDGESVLGQKLKVSVADPPRGPGRKRQRTSENNR